jgi:hypothetical protein
MKNYIIVFVFLLFHQLGNGQGAPASIPAPNKLPNVILPSPEASSILKADNLNVGLTTGALNISIPLFNLEVQSFKLPVSINYSSTGVKVNEYASSVGMGFNLNAGGVVSRTVYDKKDELREATNNNLLVNINTLNQATYNFLLNALDKESDIFTFSFGSYSGKFIIGLDNKPKQLNQQNLKIECINNFFGDGFIITTDDGTAYHFSEKEISTGRNPSGIDCPKTYELSNTTTSWFLSKIVLPSTNKEINFTYTSAQTSVENHMTETISKVVSSQTFDACYGQSNGSFACAVGSHKYTLCISQQYITSLYVSSITSSDGDKVQFIYDAANRSDLSGGKRLSSIKFQNRFGREIRNITFNASYITGAGGNLYGDNTSNKRLYLNSIDIKGGDISSTGYYQYSFTYNSPNLLPGRFAFSQDMYGYYNGKTTNQSLIPKLASTDINYSEFNNGTGTSTISFGDRSVNTLTAHYGLLNKIIYPTGGFDIVEYTSNKIAKNVSGTIVEENAGGNSVSAIKSYTNTGMLALHKTYEYITKSTDGYNGKSSAVAITKDIKFSTAGNVKTNAAASCGCTPGPECYYATVTSDPTIPLTTFGSQHLYYTSVLERTIDGTNKKGLTEHIYRYFNNGIVTPNHIMGNFILNASSQILPDILIGESYTNYYKTSGTTDILTKSIKRDFEFSEFSEFKNYSVRRAFELNCYTNPPVQLMFEQFDVEEVYINTHNVRLVKETTKEIKDNGVEFVSVNDMTYNPNYTYPKTQQTTNSDNTISLFEMKYPPDDVSLTVLNNRNIIKAPVETKYKVNSTTVATNTVQFFDWFSNQTVVSPKQGEFKTYTNTFTDKVLFNKYDVHGNLLEVQKDKGEVNSYIYGYNGSYPIAKLVNSTTASAAYTSFESGEYGGWTVFSGKVNTSYARTGTRSFELGAGNSIYKTGLSTSVKYMVSFWSRSNTAKINSVTPSIVVTKNGWNLFRVELTNISTVYITGTGIIDELKVYPADAIMETYAYEPQIGIIHTCDPNDVISSYEYDGLGRLIHIYDEEQNIVKKFCYNYAGQAESCSTYYNQEVIVAFYKTNCTTGGPYNYVVPAKKYSSTVSVAAANSLATKEANSIGQAFIDNNEVCPPPTCNTSNCTGVANKCVGGICQTGVKIYTSSVQVHGSLWECIYHYEWSDGTWSQNYTETKSSPCLNIID